MRTLVRLTHWYAEQAYDNLYSRDDDEDVGYSTLEQPSVGLPCQSETEHVLED